MYVVQGLLLSRAEAGPQQVHYAVACGTDWITRDVHVTIIGGSSHQRLELQRDQHGVWRKGSEVVPAFDGISDVDLQITPATNTSDSSAATRRWEAADTDALWFGFQASNCERLPQRYTRTAEKQYTYESHAGAFHAELDVDNEGVALRYGDILATGVSHSRPIEQVHQRDRLRPPVWPRRVPLGSLLVYFLAPMPQMIGRDFERNQDPCL